MHRAIYLPLFLLTLMMIAVPLPAEPVEGFAGSFRLETGEVLSGGYFVENGRGLFMYMDTEGLEKIGLFERSAERLLTSVLPLGIEIEFFAAPEGRLDHLEWRQEGMPAVVGGRVFRHGREPARFISRDGTRLEGTLLAPSCRGPHPAVVMVHGSGAANRHGGTADAFFLRHGVAVLSYDKRGYTAEPGAWREPDLARLAEDAAAATRWLKEQPSIDPERVGLVGFSQGGWTAPIAVTQVPAAFLIVRAGPGVSERETHLHEVRQELRAEGLGGLGLDMAIDLQREIYSLAVAGRPIADTDRLVAPYLDQPWYRAALGEGLISDRWSARWWRWAGENFPVSPTPYLSRLDIPVLWFLAELDENVPLIPSRTALERAFAKAPGRDQTIQVVKGADHSFLITEADGTQRYSREFFSTMVEWMARRGFSDAGCWQPR